MMGCARQFCPKADRARFKRQFSQLNILVACLWLLPTRSVGLSDLLKVVLVVSRPTYLFRCAHFVHLAIWCPFSCEQTLAFVKFERVS